MPPEDAGESRRVGTGINFLVKIKDTLNVDGCSCIGCCCALLATIIFILFFIFLPCGQVQILKPFYEIKNNQSAKQRQWIQH